MASRASGNGPNGPSFEASLTTRSRPSSRCTSSTGLPGSYGTRSLTAGLKKLSAISASRATERMLLGQPAAPVPAAGEPRERGVRLLRLGRLALDADAVPQCERLDRVDEALPSAAGADGEDDGRPRARADDHVVRPAGAVDEVPGAERQLPALDEQQALAREHEEVLLRPLPVVEADRLAGLEHVQVDPELPEAALALEVAVVAEPAGLAPAALGRVDHEPAVAVGDETVPRLAQRHLRNAHRLRICASPPPTRIRAA